MNRTTAATAVAALGLTVVAGLSAAAVTIGQGASATPTAAVQYVDQFGNPVAAPGSSGTASATPERVTVTERAAPAPSVGEHEEHEEDED